MVILGMNCMGDLGFEDQGLLSGCYGRQWLASHIKSYIIGQIVIYRIG